MFLFLTIIHMMQTIIDSIMFWYYMLFHFFDKFIY